MITLGSMTAVGMKKRELEFSSHPGNLSLMRNFVRGFLDNLSISERDRTLMVLGVDEACTNIIRHAYELRDELWDALRTLPPKMRAALVLRYFEDLTEAQTAHVLGCSIGTVKSQCSRGLERLRAVYGLGAQPAPDAEPDHRGGGPQTSTRRSS